MPEMRSFTALYHMWPTLHGRLAYGLSTRPSGSTFNLLASRLHGSLIIAMLICVLVWY